MAVSWTSVGARSLGETISSYAHHFSGLMTSPIQMPLLAWSSLARLRVISQMICAVDLSVYWASIQARIAGVYLPSSMLGRLRFQNSMNFTTARIQDGRYLIAGGDLTEVCISNVSPTMWWPENREWIIVSPIDLEFSLIGCDQFLASSLLSRNGIEAWQVTLDDPVYL